MTKFEHIYHQLLDCGWESSDAEMYIDFMRRKSPDSLTRIWRKYAEENQKDRKAEEDWRKKMSPNPVARTTKAYFDQYILDV